MKDIKRRLRKLERSGAFPPPPDPRDEQQRRALKQVSDEDLDLLIEISIRRDKGVLGILSERESTAVAAYEAAFRAVVASDAQLRRRKPRSGVAEGYRRT